MNFTDSDNALLGNEIWIQSLGTTNLRPPSWCAGEGEMFAFFGGNKNNNKTPEKPTKKTRKGANDATAASTGMYPEMTPAIFQQKYGMTWQEYMNLP